MLAALGCVAIACGGRAVAGESGCGVLQRSVRHRQGGCHVTGETAPDGKSSQLVATIGDYDSSPELRIAALGDSITQGIQKPEQKESGFPQYRTSLAALLAANGVKAHMLGTRTHS